VSSIDNRNACSSIRAENPEDVSTSLNPWCQAFLDAFDPQTGYARNFKAPEAKEKVSNFKNKVINTIWPHFLNTAIKNKRDEQLSPMLIMMKNHSRLYNAAVEHEKIKAQSAATHSRNYSAIEQHMGVAPSANGNAPNTSLVLESVAQGGGRPPTQAAESFARTPSNRPRSGIGGYATSAYDGSSSFAGIAGNLLREILQPVQPAGLGEQVPTAITPAAIQPPPSKKAKIPHRIKFIRDKFSTEVVCHDSTKKLQDLKHSCTEAKTDMVFRFPRETNAKLKAKTNVLKVLIGDDFEQEYDIAKHYTVQMVIDLLSPTARETTPIKIEVRVVEVKNEDEDGETYNSE
jgi:hypothetical protein